MRFSVQAESPERFLGKLAKMGGVVEEFVPGAEATSPSAQLRVSPSGETILISTHDQVLGGPSGQVYQGCRFPAADGYRSLVQEAGLKVGQVLARKGVVSRFGVDFLASRSGPDGAWALHALEINLRMGGTTHPFLALRFLVDGGNLDLASGLFRGPDGGAKFYRSTDSLQNDSYRGLTPEELFDIVTMYRLHYNQATGRGVLFHMLGALSEHGKVGLTAIGNSREDAEGLYGSTLEILKPGVGARTRAGGTAPGRGGARVSEVDPALRRELFGWYSTRMGMEMPIVRYGDWGRPLVSSPPRRVTSSRPSGCG